MGSFFPGTDPSLCNKGSISVFLSLFSQIICLQIRMAAAPDSTAVTTSDQLKRQDLAQELSTFTGNTKRYKSDIAPPRFPDNCCWGESITREDGHLKSAGASSYSFFSRKLEMSIVQAFIQFRPCDLCVQVREVPRC